MEKKIKLIIYLKNGQVLSGVYTTKEALARLKEARKSPDYDGFDTAEVV